MHTGAGEHELQDVQGSVLLVRCNHVWNELQLPCNTSEKGHLPQPISTAKGLQASAYMLPQSSGGTGFCSAADDIYDHAAVPYHSSNTGLPVE